ncbi:MAG: ATP-dependent Clp protease adaptor ClpS [Planctomycetes bacterium]|nr:ATP-dependent Clp protease adaptor ClpS [Planctomycetota bacterium]
MPAKITFIDPEPAEAWALLMLDDDKTPAKFVQELLVKYLDFDDDPARLRVINIGELGRRAVAYGPQQDTVSPLAAHIERHAKQAKWPLKTLIGPTLEVGLWRAVLRKSALSDLGLAVHGARQVFDFSIRQVELLQADWPDCREFLLGYSGRESLMHRAEGLQRILRSAAQDFEVAVEFVR